MLLVSNPSPILLIVDTIKKNLFAHQIVYWRNCFFGGWELVGVGVREREREMLQKVCLSHKRSMW